MGYLINSGSGFLSNAVQIASNKKSYLLNTTGYGAVDNIRIGYDDFGTRVYSDNGSIESYGCAAETMQALKQLESPTNAANTLFASAITDGAEIEAVECFYDSYKELENIDIR